MILPHPAIDAVKMPAQVNPQTVPSGTSARSIQDRMEGETQRLLYQRLRAVSLVLLIGFLMFWFRAWLIGGKYGEISDLVEILS